MKKDASRKIFFTVTGLKFRYGSDFLERGDIVRLVKELDNEHDSEAIKVEMDGLGKVGYVANSVHTVLGDCYSAGRLYEKVKDNAEGRVRYITDRGVVCELIQG